MSQHQPQVLVTGEIAIDHVLWNTAKAMLEQGNGMTSGQLYPYLSASMFAFLAFEACLNEMLRHLDPDVWERERKFFGGEQKTYQGTMGKFHFMADKSGLAVDTSKRPYQTVAALHRFRDSIGHGRTHIYSMKMAAHKADAATMWLEHPSAEWGKAERAARALEDVHGLLQELHDACAAAFSEYAAGYRSGPFVGVHGTREITLIQDDLPAWAATKSNPVAPTDPAS